MALVPFEERSIGLVEANPRAQKRSRTGDFIPSDPVDIDLPDFVPEISVQPATRRQRSIRERAGPSARVRILKKFRARRKQLKKELKICERDCRSLCSKKAKRSKKSKKSSKKPKKNAKKRQRK